MISKFSIRVCRQELFCNGTAPLSTLHTMITSRAHLHIPSMERSLGALPPTHARDRTGTTCWHKLRLHLLVKESRWSILQVYSHQDLLEGGSNHLAVQRAGSDIRKSHVQPWSRRAHRTSEMAPRVQAEKCANPDKLQLFLF